MTLGIAFKSFTREHKSYMQHVPKEQLKLYTLNQSLMANFWQREKKNKNKVTVGKVQD